MEWKIKANKWLGEPAKLEVHAQLTLTLACNNFIRRNKWQVVGFGEAFFGAP